MHKTGTKKQNALGAASRETALSRCFNKTNSDKKKTTFWGVPQKLDKYLIIKLLLATEFGTVPDSVLLVLWIFCHCYSTLCTRAISV